MEETSTSSLRTSIKEENSLENINVNRYEMQEQQEKILPLEDIRSARRQKLLWTAAYCLDFICLGGFSTSLRQNYLLLILFSRNYWPHITSTR
jgi:hypothetical protein